MNRLGSLGDVILTTPIVKKIYMDRGGFCEITVRTFAPEVFHRSPYVSRISHGTEPLSPADFDCFINLDLSYEKNSRVHILDAYGFYAFGSRTDFDRKCELFPGPEDIQLGHQISESFPEGYVVLHMRRAPQGSRNLPESFWREVLAGLVNETRLTVVQIGSAGEIGFGGSPRLVDFRGRLSLHQLRETIAHARCFCGVDSGPVWVASTTETNTVALYTSTRSEYRLPSRSKGSHTVLTPDIECYGCLERMPLGSTMAFCFRGDEECVNRFDARSTIDAIKVSAGVA